MGQLPHEFIGEAGKGRKHSSLRYCYRRRRIVCPQDGWVKLASIDTLQLEVYGDHPGGVA